MNITHQANEHEREVLWKRAGSRKENQERAVFTEKKTEIRLEYC